MRRPPRVRRPSAVRGRTLSSAKPFARGRWRSRADRPRPDPPAPPAALRFAARPVSEPHPQARFGSRIWSQRRFGNRSPRAGPL